MQDGHMLAWAEGLGDDVYKAVLFNLDAPAPGAAKMQRRKGLQSLQADFGTDRLIAACKLAVTNSRMDYRTLRKMLENGRDQIASAPIVASPASQPAPLANVRGAEYYAGRLA